MRGYNVRIGLLGVIGMLLSLAACAQTGGFLRHYTSAIDNSSQPYGLYVPTPYYPDVPHPVIMIGHGFGGSVSSYFSSYQKYFANTNGFLLVYLHGRGNTFYDGVGEVDFFDVLAELKRTYNVDETRIYFEGASMGATGAYRLGVRHPHILAAVGGADGWGDYRQWYTHWYGPADDPSYVAPFRLPNLAMASCVDIAENARWQHLYMITDASDATVWPQNSYALDARLTELGAATPEDDYAHVLQVVPGGHTNGYDPPTLYNYFLTKRNQLYPSQVIIKTNRLKYGRKYWAAIDRLQTVNVFGTLEAAVTGNTVTVTARQVWQCTLTLTAPLIDPDQPVTVIVNGSEAYTGPAGEITLYALPDADGNPVRWSIVDTLPGGLVKRAGMEGPIGDAYTSPFLVVYGTAGSAEATQANLAEAQAFCSDWNQWMGGQIAPRADSTITAQEIAGYNLILVGTIESHLVLREMSLPIQVHDDGIMLGTTHYAGSNYGAYFIYPNPRQPSKYVVVSHRRVPGTTPKDLEALPWYWPDYVIFQADGTPGACIQAKLAYLPTTFVEAGYFDTAWQLPPALQGVTVRASAANASVGEAVTLTATATGISTAEYRFRAGYKDDAGWHWTVLQEYSPAAACTWRPQTAGTYTLVAYVRAQGSSTPYAVYGTARVVIQSPITGVQLTSAPSSPVTLNTPVTLRAAAVGGVRPEYQFRIARNTGSAWAWTVVQAYGTSATYTWRPTAAGVYLVVASVREAGSKVPYAAYQSIQYTVTATPTLSAVQVTATPATPRPVNTPITLQATPTGGSAVEYQFRLGYRDQSGWHWTVLQPHSRAATCQWTPTVARTYTITVYAREAGSTAAYQVYGTLRYDVTP